MQTQNSPFWTIPVLAFCLSLILSLVLAPTLGLVAYQQYDFWLLWGISMLILALPLMILEIALAKRAKATPLQGFMQLTRDADRSTKWRLVSWGAVLFVPFMVGGMLDFSAQQMQDQLGLSLHSSLMVLILAVVAVALSCVPRLILLILMVLAMLGVVATGILQAPTQHWQWTAIEFHEWAKVVTLIMVTGGLGLGLYWQSALQATKNNRSAAPVALPIWLAQVVGLGVFAFVNDIVSPMQTGVLTLAVLALAALLLQLVRAQLLERQIVLVLQVVVLLVPVLLWAIPHSAVVFYPVLVICGLLLALLYAVFVGWLMKISHLRKAIQLPNEAIYNLWRMVVRIVIPLSVLLSLVGWIWVWLGA